MKSRRHPASVSSVNRLTRCIEESAHIQSLEARRLFAGTIAGTLYADLNNDTIWNSGDGRNAGWTVFVDSNNDGTMQKGESQTITDVNGMFSFAGLVAGTYVVREVVTPGWVPCWPTSSGGQSVNVSGSGTTQVVFGNAVIPGMASVTGHLFNDLNANSSWDPGDTRCVGWRVYLDANNNAAFDVTEPTAITDTNGAFIIPGLTAGTYKVREVLLAGWRQSEPRSADHYIVTLAAGGTTNVTFGNTQAISSISGATFNDENGNGVRDAGESPLKQWAVYVDSNNNDYDDPGERWTTTDNNGNFTFGGLPAGTYRVRLIQRHGWSQTLGAGSFLGVVTGTSTVSGAGFAAKQDPEPNSYSRNKLVSWINIGSSSYVEVDRHIGWNIKSQGWSGFISRYVNPQLRWGAQRILLHNPFGTAEGEGVFQADQAISAQEAGLNWVFADFVQAWQPVIASGVEVIAYLGFMKNDQSFTGLDDASWWSRFWTSMDYPLRAGMNFAFDMSLDCGPGDREWAAIEALRARGRKVYGEPRPPEGALHWTTSPLIAEDAIWAQSNPELHPETVGWAAKDSQIAGEVVRFVNHPPPNVSEADYRAWLLPGVRNVLRQGHTASVELNQFNMSSIPITDFLGGTITRPEIGQNVSLPADPLPSFRSTGQLRLIAQLEAQDDIADLPSR